MQRNLLYPIGEAREVLTKHVCQYQTVSVVDCGSPLLSLSQYHMLDSAVDLTKNRLRICDDIKKAMKRAGDSQR